MLTQWKYTKRQRTQKQTQYKAEIGIANPGVRTDSSTEEMETTGHPYGKIQTQSQPHHTQRQNQVD